jgi:hypothetical protein
MKEDFNNDGKVTMQEKILAALASYGRHFLGAAIALYMTGNTDPFNQGWNCGMLASNSQGIKSKRAIFWLHQEGII